MRFRGFVHYIANADDIPNPVQPRQHQSRLLLSVGGDCGSGCRAAIACDDTDGRDVGLEWGGDFVDLHACIYLSMKVSGLR
jgi:hypothetical protein